MIRLNRYRDGALHVSFKGLTLSVNTIVSRVLPPRHFTVKNWSENEDLAKAALESGAFIVSDVEIPTGHVNAPIWEITADHPAWMEFEAAEKLRNAS